jgi:hypothetical protein
MTDAAVYNIETDHGPAEVSLIPPATRGGMPWLAMRYGDMAAVRAAIDDRCLSPEVNEFSGKFNCHILDDGRTAQEVASAFRQHLIRAGFRGSRGEAGS